MGDREPLQRDLPEYCKECGGEGVVGTPLRECSRCDGIGIETEGVSRGEQTAIGALGGGAIGYSLGGLAGALIGGLVGVALSQQGSAGETHDPRN